MFLFCMFHVAFHIFKILSFVVSATLFSDNVHVFNFLVWMKEADFHRLRLFNDVETVYLTTMCTCINRGSFTEKPKRGRRLLIAVIQSDLTQNGSTRTGTSAMSGTPPIYVPMLWMRFYLKNGSSMWKMKRPSTWIDVTYIYIYIFISVMWNPPTMPPRAACDIESWWYSHK